MNLLNELENTKALGDKRNTLIITLTEQDILVDGDELQHVSEGEISIYADGTIDTRNGILEPIDQEAIGYAIAQGHQIFNMENVG